MGAVSLLKSIEYVEMLGAKVNTGNDLHAGYTCIEAIEQPLMAYCFEQFKELEVHGVVLL